MEKGKHVSRSTYQKLAEENKRLIADIRILVDENPSIEKVQTTLKWHNKFKEGKEFGDWLKSIIADDLKSQVKKFDWTGFNNVK
jgi:hypothetical protein